MFDLMKGMYVVFPFSIKFFAQFFQQQENVLSNMLILRLFGFRAFYLLENVLHVWKGTFAANCPGL